MNSQDVLKMLERNDALLTGHFKLTSGRHSDRYVQKQRLMEQPREAAQLAQAMVDLFAVDGSPSFDTVVSPAVGAIGLGTLVAYKAGSRFLFTERVDGEMQLRRGQALSAGEKVLIVEDIVTTGGSVQEVIDAVSATDAEVIGVTVLVDRSGDRDLSYELSALATVEVADFAPEECPMCEEGLALDSPGSRTLLG